MNTLQKIYKEIEQDPSEQYGTVEKDKCLAVIKRYMKEPQNFEQVILQKWVLTLQAYYKYYSDRSDKESLDTLLGYISSVNTLNKIL